MTSPAVVAVAASFVGGAAAMASTSVGGVATSAGLVTVALLLVAIAIVGIVTLTRRLAHGSRSGGLRDDDAREAAAQLAAQAAELERLRTDVEIARIALDAAAVREAELQTAIARERAELEQMTAHNRELRAIGTLANGVAHDMNNLLVPIVMCSQLAQEQLPRDGETYALLVDVIDAAEKGRKLVRRVLTFSRKARAGALDSTLADDPTPGLLHRAELMSRSSTEYEVPTVPDVDPET